MKDKIIRIKRSRMKPEELFLIDMINSLGVVEFGNIIRWYDTHTGDNYFSYNKKNKIITIDKLLVFDSLNKLFGNRIIITDFIEDFCSGYLNIKINNVLL